MSKASSGDKPWTLATPDGKTIYGRTIGGAKKADKAIVFVHGLTGDLSNYPCLPSAPLFARRGFDCILFNLYDWQENARRLNDCTLKVHARDIETVLAKFRRRYKNLFLLGHSYGGPSIMKADCKAARAVSLWDPSYNIADWWPHWTMVKRGTIFFKGPMDIVVPPALMREAMTLDLAGCRRLGRAFARPVQVLQAGRGILHKYGESYHSYSGQRTNFALLPDADHSFTAQDVLKDAVARTARWFNSCV